MGDLAPHTYLWAVTVSAGGSAVKELISSKHNPSAMSYLRGHVSLHLRSEDKSTNLRSCVLVTRQELGELSAELRSCVKVEVDVTGSRP